MNSALRAQALALCMFFSGYCGIVSELSLFTLAESLIGGTFVNLLLTMGVMMFCMGLGAWFAGLNYFAKASYGSFITLELLISLCVCGAMPLLTIACGLWAPLSPFFFAFLSAVIGVLIGMEIPIMQKIMQEETGEGILVVSSRVMMADYFGGLLGFVGFSLFLLHEFGLPWTAFTSGLLNLVIALLVSGMRGVPVLARCLCGVVVVGTGWLGMELDALMARGEQFLYRDKITWSEQTRFQKLVVTEPDEALAHGYDGRRLNQFRSGFKVTDGFDVKAGPARVAEKKGHLALFINGGLQFNSRDERVYHEHLIHGGFALNSDVRTVLLMGAGDGLALREVFRHEGVERAVLVELDPAMVEAFRSRPELVRLNAGALSDSRLEVIHQDAWKWAKEGDGFFDLIILDFPDPHHVQTAKLYTRQFYTLLSHHLKPGGVLVTQATSPLYDRKGFWSIGKTLESAGFEVASLHVEMVSFGQWGFHLASKSLNRNDMVKRLESWPLKLPLSHASGNSMRSGLAWGPEHDRLKAQVPINEITDFALMDLYRKRE
jgi:spermidine synthase